MSDDEVSRSSADERVRKGKGIKYSDDDQKGIGDKTKEHIPSLPSSGLSSEDYSIFNTVMERDGGGSLADFFKEQQQAYLLLQQTKIPLQKKQKSESSPKDSESKEDISKEDIGPIKELIFELEISERNRLVIPYTMASDHFPPMMISPNAEETLHLFDTLGRMWKMNLIYDSVAHTYIITNGLKAYLEHNHLNPPDSIRVYRPVPQLNITDFHIQHLKILGEFLFEVLVSRSNRLSIPCDVANNYFTPSEALPPPDHLREYTLSLTDYLNRTWNMKFIFFKDEEAYIVVRGWEHYVAYHGLNHRDTIRFFRRNHSGRNSFIVYHKLGQRRNSSMLEEVDPSLFLAEEMLCELRLSEADVGFGRLELPGFEMPFEIHDQEMVKLTDENNKHWYVILVFTSFSREYTILDGWEGIVREHNLEAGDVVRFYEPVFSDHSMHFLIECVKKKKNTEKEEGRSGSGKPDDGAGPSRKGKEIAK